MSPKSRKSASCLAESEVRAAKPDRSRHLFFLACLEVLLRRNAAVSFSEEKYAVLLTLQGDTKRRQLVESRSRADTAN